MKALALAIPLAAAAGVAIGVHAATPWFSPQVEDLVSFTGTTGPIGTGSSVVIATVPANQHLVISDVRIGMLYGNGYAWTLVQRDSSGAETVKVPRTMLLDGVGNSVRASADGEGLVFEPGTDLVIKYPNPSGSGVGEMEYLLVGHYRNR